MRNVPPFVTRSANRESIGFDRLAALLPVIALALVGGGMRAFWMIFAAGAAAAAVEGVFFLIAARARFSVMPIAIGLSVALVCPLSAPIAMVAAGSAVAAAVYDLCLHFRRSFFVSPAALAWLLLLLIAPGVMTSFPAYDSLKALPPLRTPDSFDAGFSILADLAGNVLPNLSVSDLLLGRVAGGFGSAAVLGSALALVYLGVRKSAAWESAVSLILTVLCLTLLVRRMAVSAVIYALLELSGGSLLFGAVFMASDFSAPKTRAMRILYGVICGYGMVEMRMVGFGEFSVPFVIVSTGILLRLAEWGLYRLALCRKNRQEHSESKDRKAE